MKKIVAILSLALISLLSCQKKMDVPTANSKENSGIASTEIGSFVEYSIAKGAQYCDKSALVATRYDHLSFVVKFDSSAIYQTADESNQYDINKLYGFSDNKAQHHDYSARFGWRWSNDSLRLFAYVYNQGVMSFKELGTVTIGSEINCAIKVEKERYVFSLNGQETLMPRLSTTDVAEGYKLYPYFGGDELAPHFISIRIKELPGI